MNSFLSGLIAAVMAAIATYFGGFFQEGGFVAIGDARISAPPVGWAAIIAALLAGLMRGGKINWLDIFKKLKDAFVPSKTLFNGPSTPGTPSIETISIDRVPAEVEHIGNCIYYLRKLLREDPEAQTQLDAVALKAGRMTAGVGVKP